MGAGLEPYIGRFAGKVVVVTGGAQGIGRAIAERFHSAGASIYIVDRNAQAGRGAVSSMTGSTSIPATLIQADLSDKRAILRIAKELGSLSQRVDVLVNNAGIEIEQSIENLTTEAWEQTQAVNLRAPLLLTQALLPYFPRSGGSIINISSIHATHAFPNSISYACSKAGLLALTRNLALELANRQIRVNAICPGYIDTQLWDDYLKSVDNPEQLAETTRALHPLGRRGLPEDIAGAALFLADSDSSFMTGGHLVIDGGLTLRAHP
jgi:NAD(P)-dependent dehydrogenase (short-subunit alcohol dehydrogenase family)